MPRNLCRCGKDLNHVSPTVELCSCGAVYIDGEEYVRKPKVEPNSDVEERVWYCAVIRIREGNSHRKRRRVYSYWTLRDTKVDALETACDLYRKSNIVRVAKVRLVEVPE